jgi:monoamine oxidase
MTSDNKKIARREFLTSIGRLAGSAAMLRTMAAMGIGLSAASCGSSSAAPGGPVQPPPPLRLQSPRPGDWPANVVYEQSVVISAVVLRNDHGTGNAKLATPARSSAIGAGGRNRTIRAGDSAVETDSVQVCTFDVDADLYFNPGPARISHHHEFLLGYCRQFGVALETFVNDNHAALLHSTTAFGGQPQIKRRVVADTRGSIARLLAKAVNQNALDQDLSAADKANILAMLQEFGDLDGAYEYTGTERAGFPGQENSGSRQRGELVSPLQLQELISDTFWQMRQDYAQGLDQQPTMLQPVGGMDRIARAFESQVAADIVYEAVVREIRKTANGVRIVYQDRFGSVVSLDADYCVCTIPATVLRNIVNDFSSMHQSAIASFDYASAGKIGFQSRRFWEQDHNIYGGISWTTQDITQIWYPNHGFGRDSGILVGAYMFGGSAGNTFAAQSPRSGSMPVSPRWPPHPEYAEVARGISVAG